MVLSPCGNNERSLSNAHTLHTSMYLVLLKACPNNIFCLTVPLNRFRQVFKTVTTNLGINVYVQLTAQVEFIFYYLVFYVIIYFFCFLTNLVVLIIIY